MTLLVTGATGFVMSVLARHWLESDPAARLVVLDASPLDAAAQRYFAPCQEPPVRGARRRDAARAPGAATLAGHAVTHIVHGATVTPLSRGTAAEAKREPEAESPGRIIDVNVMGTVAVLDWARTLPNLQALHLCQLGGGLQAPWAGSPRRTAAGGRLRDAATPVRDLEARLGADHRALRRPVRPVDRLGASVLGLRPDGSRDGEPQLPPRPQPDRALRPGGREARARQHARCGRRLHPRRGRGGGDRRAAARAAPALQRLQRRLRQDREHRRARRPGQPRKCRAFMPRSCRPSRPISLQDPLLRDGMWGAYDVSRIAADTGWQPRPVREALHAYMDWLVAERSAARAGHQSEPGPVSARPGRLRLAAHPQPRWPGEARIAVSLVLNYEEGGETCVLHGDAHSESVLTDLGAVAPLPGARDLNVESNFEYGSRVGFWEIMRLLQGAGVDGHGVRRRHGAGAQPGRPPREIARSGFEVACHGQRWIDYQSVPEARWSAPHMQRNIETITRLIGRRPLGWYTGRPSVEHAPAGGGERRLPLRQRRLQRRPALLDHSCRQARTWWCRTVSTTTTAACSAAAISRTGEHFLQLLP